MRSYNRRHFIAQTSAAALCASQWSLCVRANHVMPPAVGKHLFLRYFSVHTPTANVRGDEQAEFNFARQAIQEHVMQYLADVAAVIGTAPLEQRLADVARHNPIADDAIPLIYSPRPSHSHNILAGIPYTGVYLGRSPSIDFIAPHEVGHIVFGKFNDALTEPVANLFVRPAPTPLNPCALNLNERIQLLPNEAVLLAVLELWSEGTPIADARSLGDFFAHRPSYRLLADARYRYELDRNAHCAKESAKATNAFLAKLISLNYEDDFKRHGTLDLPILTRVDRVKTSDWVRRHGRHAIASRALNPNESRGFIRDFHGLLDSGLMKYMIEAGLPNGFATPIDQVTPAEARKAICMFLQFHFNPNAGVALYGHETLDGLEKAIRVSLSGRGQGLLGRMEWFQLKDALRQSRCYQPETWNEAECSNSDRNSSARYDRGVTTFLSAMRPVLLPAGARKLNPVVQRALEEPDHRPLLSLVGPMGEDLNFDKYFSLV